MFHALKIWGPATVVVFTVAGAPANAQTGSSDPAPDVATEDSLRKFDDPERLIDTLMADDQTQLASDLEANSSLVEAAELEEQQLQGATTEAGTTFDEALTAVSDADDAQVIRNAVDLGNELETRQQELEELLAIEAPDDAEKARIDELQGDTGIIATVEGEKTAADTLVQELADSVEPEDAEGAAAAKALLALKNSENELADAQAETLALKDDATSLQDGFDTELAAITKLVNGEDGASEGMTPEQIFAFNRSLNNAASSGLLPDIDSESFAGFFDDEGNLAMSRQQINAFTKAYEAEAKFIAIGERTGQAEKFAAKAERQKDKFLGKAEAGQVGRDNESRAGTVKLAKVNAKANAKASAKASAKGSAKQSAKQASKQAAKAAAKQAAKGAAKDSAKGAAKQAAKQSAKQAAKQVAKEEAKGKGKGKGKDKKNS